MGRVNEVVVGEKKIHFHIFIQGPEGMMVT